MESYISRNIEGTYNVTFQLKACVKFFFFFLVYPAIEQLKKKKSSLRPCKERLGEFRAPGRTVAELKVAGEFDCSRGRGRARV